MVANSYCADTDTKFPRQLSAQGFAPVPELYTGTWANVRKDIQRHPVFNLPFHPSPEAY